MHGQIQIHGQFEFIANAWASSNTWANLLQMHGKLMQIHGHPQMHGQPLRHAFMVKCFMNTWSESVPNVNALSNLEIQMYGQCECIVSIIECKIEIHFQMQMHCQ